MTVPLELIQILDAIDQYGSFEAAARSLHKVRSALTYTIRCYEQYSGITVFDRSQHKARFTDAGKILLEQGRELLVLNHQIEENAQFTALGWETVVRIAYDELLNTAPIFTLINNFQQACPKTNLEVFSEVLNGCSHALMNNRVDIAIGLTGRLPTTGSSTLQFEPFGKSKFVFVVTPHHPLASYAEPIAVQVINQFTRIVVRDSAHRYQAQTLNIIEHQKQISVTSLELKRQAQLQGIGVGFMPYNLVASDIKQGRLLIKKVAKSPPQGMLYMGWNKHKNYRAQQWLIEQIRNKQFQRALLSASL